ncbi:hypothetical protein MBLNU459_g1166t1 [Dothideomycetes sp. NU459]
MAGSAPVSFDEYLQNDRKKRKAEQLAQDILGSGGRSSPHNAAGRRSSPHIAGGGGSLASRMGVVKRSHNGAPPNASARLSHAEKKRYDPYSRAPRSQPLADKAPPSSDLFPLRVAKAQSIEKLAPEEAKPEVSIRGAAGPYCVVARNFAPGTTAADVESVMQPVGGDMADCKLVSSHPTVVIEMLFLNKSGADSVVSMFNNRRADGELLEVYLKNTRTDQSATKPSTRTAAYPHDDDRQSGGALSIPSSDTRGKQTPRNDLMEVDESSFNHSARTPTGPRADRPARDNYKAPRGDGSNSDNYGRPYRGPPEHRNGRDDFSRGHRNGDHRRGKDNDRGRFYSDGPTYHEPNQDYYRP